MKALIIISVILIFSTFAIIKKQQQQKQFNYHQLSQDFNFQSIYTKYFHNKSTQISLYNLQIFFNFTYDMNQDGVSTLEQFIQYYNFLEPIQGKQDQYFDDNGYENFNGEQQQSVVVIQRNNKNLQKQMRNSTLEALFYSQFDLNKDSKFTLQELIQKIQHEKGYKVTKKLFEPGHKQIHLGLTGQMNLSSNFTQMQVMWVSTPQVYSKPVVQYSEYLFFNQQDKEYQKYQIKTINATFWTYNQGHIGFHGRIYHGVMKDLIPNKKYYYRVGDLQTSTFSQVKQFIAANYKSIDNSEIRYAVVGDVGTYTPFGFRVLHQIAISNLVLNYNFMFLTGDIAYAGVSSQKKGQIEPIWDLFGQLSSKFAAFIPFMPGVGNHQKYYNYAAYQNRYTLPDNGSQNNKSKNLWFDFDYGRLHVIHFSSQSPYSKGSQQYQFIQNSLKRATERFKNLKNLSGSSIATWIVLSVHRTFYCPDQREFGQPTSLSRQLEDLIKKYKVDLIHTGHHHDYSRTWPVYKQVREESQTKDQYMFVRPENPIYVVQGTGGALPGDKQLKQIPKWTVKRIVKYGFGRVILKDNTLKYQFVQAPSGKILDHFIIIK